MREYFKFVVRKLIWNRFWNPLKLYSPSRAVIDPTSRDAELARKDVQKLTEQLQHLREHLQKVQNSRKLH